MLIQQFNNDKQISKGRNVSVPSMTSDDANVNTRVNTKDNDGSKCCIKMHQDGNGRIKCSMTCNVVFFPVTKFEGITDVIS